jgi:hypothetical protein
MFEFKLLKGDLKKVLHSGNYSMTLEVLEDNLLFVEVQHHIGNITATMSEIIEIEYSFKTYVEYGERMMNHYCGLHLSVRTILSDLIFVMRHV